MYCTEGKGYSTGGAFLEESDSSLISISAYEYYMHHRDLRKLYLYLPLIDSYVPKWVSHGP